MSDSGQAQHTDGPVPTVATTAEHAALVSTAREVTTALAGWMTAATRQVTAISDQAGPGQAGAGQAGPGQAGPGQATTVPGQPVPGQPGASPGQARVQHEGREYPAAEVAHGAAYELFSGAPEDGFLPNPRPGAHWPYRRFVHATDVTVVETVEVPEALEDPLRRAPDHQLDSPLVAPVSRALSWASLHHLSQTPPDRYTKGEADLMMAVRRSATIRRGTPMLKILSGRQVAGYLTGWPLAGFCHREYDLAHLRTPGELAPASSGPDLPDEVIFAIRWRAVDPLDYTVPLDGTLRPAAAGEVDSSGLVAMPPQERVGPQVLGTGFAPTRRHLIPEWVTADYADLPLPAATSIVAFTADGTEVVLYTYLPEQRAWLRMCGPQWRGLLGQIPTTGSPEQEYFPVTAPASRLIGTYRGQLHEAIADPPGEFRVAAKTRTTRYHVDSLARRTRYAVWRDTPCTVVRAHGDWRQVRLCRPDAENVRRLGASCVERGVYEAWAPSAELVDDREVDLRYELAC